VQGTDVALRRAIVAERLAGGLDAAGDGGVGYDAAVPHSFQQFVARHEAVAILDQVRQQREDLGFHAAGLAACAQFRPRQIELELAEPVDHGPEHRSRAGRARDQPP